MKHIEYLDFNLKSLTRPLRPFLDRVHPNDKDRVHEAINHSLNKKTDYYIIHRIVKKDGAERYVLEEAEGLK